MDQFDRNLVEYVLSWAPFGGPPAEEILPRFGFPSDQLGKRIRDIAYPRLRRIIEIDERVLLGRALDSVERGAR